MTDRVPCPACGAMVAPHGLPVHQRGSRCALAADLTKRGFARVNFGVDHLAATEWDVIVAPGLTGQRCVWAPTIAAAILAAVAPDSTVYVRCVLRHVRANPDIAVMLQSTYELGGLNALRDAISHLEVSWFL